MEPWHVKLFKKSVLKQEKFQYLTEFCANFTNKRCLDLGSDNGIVSYLFRQAGGSWASADIEEDAVLSIRNLVGTDVHHIDGKSTPFKDEEFNLIVIVDLLEHIVEDQQFLAELNRILKKGGNLVINVPNIKKWSIILPARNLLGLTDDQHGHVRPGYSYKQLEKMLPDYIIEKTTTYSKFFTELIDICISLPFKLLKKGKDSKKGVLVTEREMKKHKKLFVIYNILYPFLWLFSKLDLLLAPLAGYRLILRAKKK